MHFYLNIIPRKHVQTKDMFVDCNHTVGPTVNVELKLNGQMRSFVMSIKTSLLHVVHMHDILDTFSVYIIAVCLF